MMPLQAKSGPRTKSSPQAKSKIHIVRTEKSIWAARNRIVPICFNSGLFNHVDSTDGDSIDERTKRFHLYGFI